MDDLDGHPLRHLTVPVDDDDRLSTGREANQLARPVTDSPIQNLVGTQAQPGTEAHGTED
jgi:hypothetical protein